MKTQNSNQTCGLVQRGERILRVLLVIILVLDAAMWGNPAPVFGASMIYKIVLGLGVLSAVLVIALSFPFAWLTLKSGSLWPAVLLHAFHNQFIQGMLDKLTGKNAITPYITGEFGVGLASTGLLVAYVFWRMQREKPLQFQPAHLHSMIPAE